ncbi:MAG: galactosyldiacylglycerol synthase [Massilia sp.]|nr:galactosyldiacylglycerol synthase [Massilia sp.]
MRTRVVVVLSVSAGAGHVRAAAALCAAAAAGPDAPTTIHLDVMDYVPRWYRCLYAGLYAVLVNHSPMLWGWLYRVMNRPGPAGPVQRLRRLIERHCSARWLREIATLKPDAIICTHFLPAEVLSQMRASGAVDCPVWVQVTDFDLHALWVHPHMAGYFVASEEIAFQLRRSGIAAEHIHVTGIPLMPSFAAPAPGRGWLRELDLAPQVPTVLLMGGGGGVGGLVTVAQGLLDAHEQFQLIVLTGSNAGALAALHKLAHRWPGRLAPLGFTDQVARLMASVDLVITKPGGLTTSECLAIGVPMLVNAPIPGQEERNADFLLEQGAALKAVDAATLAYRLNYLLARPALLGAMGARARELGRPGAARQVIDIVLAQLQG